MAEARALPDGGHIFEIARLSYGEEPAPTIRALLLDRDPWYLLGDVANAARIHRGRARTMLAADHEWALDIPASRLECSEQILRAEEEGYLRFVSEAGVAELSFAFEKHDLRRWMIAVASPTLRASDLRPTTRELARARVYRSKVHVKSPESQRDHTLYRLYDSAGELLYVGISWSIMLRMARHRAHKDWFPAVARIEVQHYPSREETREAERKAIAGERPRYNIAS